MRIRTARIIELSVEFCNDVENDKRILGFGEEIYRYAGSFPSKRRGVPFENLYLSNCRRGELRESHITAAFIAALSVLINVVYTTKLVLRVFVSAILTVPSAPHRCRNYG